MSAADAARQAARMEDPIEHGIGLLGMLAGMLLGAIVGAILIAATIATGGAALAIALAVVGAVGAVAGGGLAGGQLARGLATSGFIPSGITSGTLNPPCSLNVITGLKPQARAVLDTGKCSGVFSLFHFPLPMTPIAEGSATVIVNNMPAARQGDKLVCGADIQLGEPTVLIGGETVRLLEVHDLEAELTEILTYVAIGAAVAGLLLLGGGYLAGAICGTVLLKALAVGALMFGANWMLGQVGDAIGPGWRDTLQGAFGIGSLLYSGYRGLRMFGGRPFIREPIDAVTGEVGIRQTDFALPAALPLALTRTYISGLGHGSCFGPKWCSTWGQWITLAGQQAFFFTDDGRSINFDLPADEAAEARNRYVNRVTLQRTADGFRVRDEENRILKFERQLDERWLLTSIEDLNGNAIRIGHDDEGAIREVNHSGGYRLRVESTPAEIKRITLLAEDGAETELARYEYTASGHLSAIIKRNGAPFRFDYDEDGRITRWTDQVGNWYEYKFDRQGRCIEATGPDQMYHSIFAYDEENGITTCRDSLGHTTTYKYNERLQVVETINPLGGSTFTSWDERSNKLEEQNPNGQITSYEYDANGNVVSIVNPDGSSARSHFNELGLPTRLIDGHGKVWRRDYDDRGNLLLAASPSLGAWRYNYDERGNLVKVTDAAGRRREFGYDARGLRRWDSDWVGNRIEYERDALGNVILRTDRARYQTRYAYNAAGELSVVTLPTGAQLSWEYDAAGNVTRFRDGQGRATRYVYGVFNHLIEMQEPSGGRLRYVHDTESNLLQFINETGEVFKYEYDAMGKVIRETDFAGRTVTYEYNPAGHLIKQTNGLGETIAMERDPFGQIVRKVAPDGSAVEFDYDPLGNVVRAANDTGEIIYERDEYGRVTKETQNGRVVESVFDLSGQRTHRRTSTGHECVFKYDDNGVLIGLDVPGGEQLTFTRDANSRETERRATGGLTLRHEYDALNRVTHQLATAPPPSLRAARQQPAEAQTIAERSYSYDNANNPVEIKDSIWGDAAYTYDQMDLILSVRQEQGLSEEFAYDPAESITRSTRTMPRRTPPGAIQMPLTVGAREWVTEAGGRVRAIGSTQYEYDGEGRIISRTENNPLGGVRRWQYAWNSLGQLHSVRLPEGHTWEYAYDALGRRVSKKGPGETITYVWDHDVIVEELSDKAETAARVWIYEPGCWRPLVKQQGEKTFHCLTDHLGTPKELVTGAGHVAWSARLTFWGELERVGAHETDCPIRFQGQWFDDESGLANSWFRYYDPARGAFMSPDPIGLDGDKKIYAFPRTPAAWIDPYGLQNDYIVYGLYRPGETTPYYVGRTDQPNFAGTTTRHATPSAAGDPARLPPGWREAGYRHEPIQSGLTYDEARGLEQHYMEQYGTRTGTRPGNIINGIRPDRTGGNAARYRQAARNRLGCGGT
jgi:RHS repeat-associated protein